MTHKKLHLRIVTIILLVLASFSVGIVTGVFIVTTPKNIPDTPTPTLPETTATPLPQETSFIIVGDIMLSRNVARHAEKSGKPAWIWANIRSFLDSADFVIGNLE